ncbi:MAG: ribonuclease P protein component [Bacilli bacterium]|nr:ribonuclease P protein component [Bacilli bacterium]
MKKINIVKNSRDFDSIIKNNKSFKYKDYIFYVVRNISSVYKFGIAVPKKIGSAVIRNKIKRRIKSILDKKDYKNDFNCIIIVGKGILTKSFEEMSNNLYDALAKLDLLKENSDEK